MQFVQSTNLTDDLFLSLMYGYPHLPVPQKIYWNLWLNSQGFLRSPIYHGATWLQRPFQGFDPILTLSKRVSLDMRNSHPGRHGFMVSFGWAAHPHPSKQGFWRKTYHQYTLMSWTYLHIACLPLIASCRLVRLQSIQYTNIGINYILKTI